MMTMVEPETDRKYIRKLFETFFTDDYLTNASDAGLNVATTNAQIEATKEFSIMKGNIERPTK